VAWALHTLQDVGAVGLQRSYRDAPLMADLLVRNGAWMGHNAEAQAASVMMVAAGEAVWAAGPLAKGSNLCHGTGGNGYASLKLCQRAGNALWLQRARAFAMHGIAQTEAHAAQQGQMRYSLWTGDPGFAIYLWDCLRGRAEFPTLDVFYSPTGA
jgi:hypothetical protein